MNSNIGTIDRIIRLAAGVCLIALPLFTQTTVFENSIYRYLAIVIGTILVLTALVKFCPAYRLLGIGTRHS